MSREQLDRAIKRKEGELARHTYEEDDKYFDVSHTYDAEFAGQVVDNPFKGLSTFPDLMVPFQRPDMEQSLRMRVREANRAHWALPSDGGGPKGHINPLKLRQPTADEAKALKLGPDAKRFANEAAHIRAYLAQLDREAEAKAKEERARKRQNLKAKMQGYDAQRPQWERMIDDNLVAAERHEKRLRDEEAYKLTVLARNEIAAIDQRIETARRELERL